MLHLLYQTPQLLAVDIKGLKPNTTFEGSQWVAVIVDLILGIGFMLGLIATARGAIAGGAGALRGRDAGLGDMGWQVGAGIAVMVFCTFFGVIISYLFGLFG